MRSKLKRLHDLPDVRGRYVIVRAGLNVPVADGKVTNQFRIVRALPTLNKLRQAGARIILMGHLGRDPHDSLYPVYEVLSAHVPMKWAGGLLGDAVAEARAGLQNGEVLLLENVRQDVRETENDPALADALAALGEYFVNDAFADSHRDHASVSGIAARLPTYFGLNFMHEYDELTKARQPDAPAVFLLGGAKFETKLPLVEQFLAHYDYVFVGGALANDVFKARGYEIGQSLVSDIDLSGSALLENEKILVPVDVEVDGPRGRRTCAPDAVQHDERILDAGPGTVAMLSRHVLAAKTILWNGPLGNFEAGYDTQTKALAQVIADAPGYAIIGGGDTIAAIESLGCQECFTFMSTAGGAMLTFLESGTLAGIDAALAR